MHVPTFLALSIRGCGHKLVERCRVGHEHLLAFYMHTHNCMFSYERCAEKPYVIEVFDLLLSDGSG